MVTPAAIPKEITSQTFAKVRSASISTARLSLLAARASLRTRPFLKYAIYLCLSQKQFRESLLGCLKILPF
jgi:hypothetical protein